MDAQLQQVNSCLAISNTIASRPLEVYSDLHNPIRLVGREHNIVITRFADGELLLEIVNRTLDTGFRRSTTESELGHTFAGLLNLAIGRGRAVKIQESDGRADLIIGKVSGDNDNEFESIRVYIVLTDRADPHAIGIKLLALKSQRKLQKLNTARMETSVMSSDPSGQLSRLLARIAAAQISGGP